MGLTNFEKVIKFHEKFKITVGDFANPKLNDHTLRMKLIREEFEELMEAFEDGNDIAHICQELTDLLFVVYGTGVSMGLDLDKSFELIYNSNMSKLDDDGTPIYRDDGKILKSDNYVPADLSEVANGRKRPTTN